MIPTPNHSPPGPEGSQPHSGRDGSVDTLSPSAADRLGVIYAQGFQQFADGWLLVVTSGPRTEACYGTYPSIRSCHDAAARDGLGWIPCGCEGSDFGSWCNRPASLAISANGYYQFACRRCYDPADWGGKEVIELDRPDGQDSDGPQWASAPYIDSGLSRSPDDPLRLGRGIGQLPGQLATVCYFAHVTGGRRQGDIHGVYPGVTACYTAALGAKCHRFLCGFHGAGNSTGCANPAEVAVFTDGEPVLRCRGCLSGFQQPGMRVVDLETMREIPASEAH